MQLIDDCARKLGDPDNPFTVFVGWVHYRGFKSQYAVDHYEVYCDTGKIPTSLENFCIDVLANRINIPTFKRKAKKRVTSRNHPKTL